MVDDGVQDKNIENLVQLPESMPDGKEGGIKSILRGGEGLPSHHIPDADIRIYGKKTKRKDYQQKINEQKLRFKASPF